MDQNTQYSIDYLNQISPTQAPRRSNNKFLIVVIGIVVVCVIAFMFILFGGKPKVSDKWTDLYLRIGTIETVATKHKSLLKDSDIRATNSKLILYLSDAKNEIKGFATQSGAELGKISKERTAKETKFQAELTDKLEEAKVMATLDRTYAREMSYQITLLSSMMLDVYKTSGPKTRETLENISDNLVAVAKQLKDFEDTK